LSATFTVITSGRAQERGGVSTVCETTPWSQIADNENVAPSGPSVAPSGADHAVVVEKSGSRRAAKKHALATSLYASVSPPASTDGVAPPHAIKIDAHDARTTRL
jgi:hypothetical protein